MAETFGVMVATAEGVGILYRLTEVIARRGGNILSVEEKPAVGDAEKQCFRTDPLGRLAKAWT